MFAVLGIDEVNPEALKKTFNVDSNSYEKYKYPEKIDVNNVRNVKTIVINNNFLRLSGRTKPNNHLVLFATGNRGSAFTAQEIPDTNGEFTFVMSHVLPSELFTINITDDIIILGSSFEYRENYKVDFSIQMIYSPTVLQTNTSLFENKVILKLMKVFFILE